jgi:transposase
MNVGRAVKQNAGAGKLRGGISRLPAAIFERLRREIDRLRREIDRLRREGEQLRRKLTDERKKADSLERKTAELEKKQSELEKELADRDKKISDLEHQLAARKKNSTNSSKPPSSDGPSAEKRIHPQRRKSKRKPGGQKGHRGCHRQLVPTDQVDKVVQVLPQDCKHCGKTFPKNAKELPTRGEPHRHPVTEIPEIKPHITEFQFPEVICGDCGRTTRASLTAEIRNQFGPKLTAFLGFLTVVCRMPRRKMEELLKSVTGISISLGSTQKAVEETSAALQPCHQELQQQLPKEPVLNGDETGWRSDGEKRWLWVLVARSFAFFAVAKSRSSEVLRQLLGPTFLGILCSDRFSAYIKYHKGIAQFCWAHLKRDLLGIQQLGRTTEGDRFSRDALALHARLFRLWHRFRAGDIDRSQLILKSIPLEKRFFALAENHLDSADAEVCTLAKLFFNHTERLFAFIQYPGVEPTNNISERTIRTAVQWRKISFGNRSEAGEIATARLLTAAATCRMQNRNVLEFLTETVRAHRAGRPAPSLLLPQA